MESILKRRGEDQVISKLIKMWPLVAAVIGGIVSFSILRYRVDEHEVRIVKIERSMQDIDSIKSNTDILLRELVGTGRRRRD